MHSPWGINFNIIKEMGLSWHELLWQISWVNIRMMIADAPGYKSGKGTSKGKELESEDDFREFLKL